MCESTDLISWVINCSGMISDSSFFCFRGCMRAVGSPGWQGCCAVHGGTPAVPSCVSQSLCCYSSLGEGVLAALSHPAPWGDLHSIEALEAWGQLIHPHVGSGQLYQWPQVSAPRLASPGLLKAFSQSGALFQPAPAGKQGSDGRGSVGRVHSAHRRLVQGCSDHASCWTMHWVVPR